MGWSIYHLGVPASHITGNWTVSHTGSPTMSKTSKLRITGPGWNQTVSGGFASRRVNNMESASMLPYHVFLLWAIYFLGLYGYLTYFKTHFATRKQSHIAAQLCRVTIENDIRRQPALLAATSSWLFQNGDHDAICRHIDNHKSMSSVNNNSALRNISVWCMRISISLKYFLDFSKAFDTVDHDILISKLFHYGIRGPAHKWFTSYISNRKQYVTHNIISSTMRNIACGVPLGSILGLLFFHIYINDLCKVCNFTAPILLADDTNIFCNGCDLQVVEKISTGNSKNFKMVEDE